MNTKIMLSVILNSFKKNHYGITADKWSLCCVLTLLTENSNRTGIYSKSVSHTKLRGLFFHISVHKWLTLYATEPNWSDAHFYTLYFILLNKCRGQICFSSQPTLYTSFFHQFLNLQRLNNSKLKFKVFSRKQYFAKIIFTMFPLRREAQGKAHQQRDGAIHFKNAIQDSPPPSYQKPLKETQPFIAACTLCSL